MGRQTKGVVRWLVVIGVIAAFLYAGWWYLCESVLYASIGYEVEAELTELPPDDAALEAWLQQQPGVLHTLTEINRTGPSGKGLQVNVGMSRNAHGRPPFPDLEKACAELGYKGQVAPFRDTRLRPAH